ncbi:MAG: formylglycine-generating enzyme family protein [Planctomycetes bacterium]|nr:formylglycine-generating enzyme family protein [Planctomycetota bacterium]
MRVRRRAAVVVALLLLAGGVAAFLVPSRQSGRGAVPARDDDARRILRDVAAWDAATHDERRAAAAWVAARTDGFAFDGTETFGFDGHRHEIAVFAHAATGLEFSLIPGGTFLKGSPDGEAERSSYEGPQHSVTIPGAFLLCRTETTQAGWERVMGKNPSTGTIGADHPVETVSWNDAQSFCGKTGLRLPSESEWEYSCRAGTTTRFWSGDDEAGLKRVAWFGRDPGAWTQMMNRLRGWLRQAPPATDHHPAALKGANPFGLHDIHGNVWEWCEDAWQPDYVGAPADGAARRSEAASDRVIRGGGWSSTARYARSAIRGRITPGLRLSSLGFRPARSVAP